MRHSAKGMSLPAVVPFVREAQKDIRRMTRTNRRYDPSEVLPLPQLDCLDSSSSSSTSKSFELDSSDDDDSSLYSSGRSLPDSVSSRPSTKLSSSSDDTSHDSTKSRPTLAKRIEIWKAKNRAARRHPTLVYFEQLAKREHDAAEMRVVERRREEEERLREQERRQAKVDAAKALRDKVARRGAERHERAERQRAIRHQTVQQRMLLVATANLARAREKEQSTDATVTLAPNAEQAQQVDEDYADEVALSHLILGMQRAAGLLPGVNVPKPVAPPAPRETDQSVHVYLVNNRLNLQLKRFRNADTLKCEALGLIGAQQLAKHLAHGVCPSLTVVDLAYNAIQLAGIKTLCNVLPSKLTRLSLAANHLPPRTVDYIAPALKSCSLKVLDLRHNQLMDEGACKLASALLGGNFCSLTDLSLTHNDIRHKGFKALFLAFTATAVPCPDIHTVNLRYNKPLPQTIASLVPCPPFFMI